MSAKVSIILPVYNQSKWLPKAIDSILAQKYKNFELIVLNDGSTENIDGVLKNYADPRIFYLSLHHRGLVETLNKGLSLATGKYINWTSADNILEPNFLQELVPILKKNTKYGAVYADYVQIDKDGKIIKKMSKGMPDGKKNFGPAFLYRASVVRKVGDFDKKLELVEDRDYSIRMAKAAPVYWHPKMLYKYRIHQESLTNDIISGKKRTRFQQARKWLWAKHADVFNEKRG